MIATISPDELGTPEVIADPFPAYAALRDASPLRYPRVRADKTNAHSESSYAWALMRHADIMSALRDPAAFSSNTPLAFKATAYFPLIHDDPPRHTQIRRVINKSLSPARVAEMSGWIGQLVDEMLDAAGPGPIEFMQGYAFPLPIRVMAKILGLPDSDHAAFKSWSEAYVSYASMPAEERARKLLEMAHYLPQAIAERRARPTGDLISIITEAEVDGKSLSDEHMSGLVSVVIFAASETTTNLIGNLLGLLADRPELWWQMRADRSLVDPVIEEALRYQAPLQRKLRLTTRPVRVGETEIGPGELVDLCYGAANRDPAVFEDPETFRPGRPDVAQLISFGHGIHYCPGAMLSRIEVRLTVNALLDRYASLERGDSPAERQRAAPLAFGYRTLPLVFR
ncbi:cytochrome P450 [Nannocystis radixulma]|uniref:Cytochrome P450 n=1 Tax=Nannocystis radixulma TaxID=2995305 RepID=A0ABT5BGE2_9BACT|nr:cytochrome P450 [Nannocystis radixulma]MDC0672503.1 cytochrome P450 [Nannocystis radixulma]